MLYFLNDLEKMLYFLNDLEKMGYFLHDLEKMLYFLHIFLAHLCNVKTLVLSISKSSILSAK